MIYIDAIIQLICLLSISSFFHPVYRCKNTSPGAKDNRGLAEMAAETVCQQRN